MDVSEAIEKALPVFAKYKNFNDEDLETALKQSGIPSALSYKLVEFMPLAFGRIFMEGFKISFQEEFVRYIVSEGTIIKKQQRRLDSEKVYVEAVKTASRMFNKKISVDEFQSVAIRSAEFQAVNEMVNKGSKPENIVLTQPYLQWREDTEKQDDAESKQSQSWWQFWRKAEN